MADWAGSKVCFCLVLALLTSLPQPSSPQPQVNHDCPEYKVTLCTGKPLLTVKYSGVSVTCDSLQTEEKTRMPPTVDFAGSTEGTKYLLVMTDPDAPQPCQQHAGQMGDYMHYMAVMQRKSGALQVETTHVQYEGPTPPMGIHRYQLRLFQMKGDALQCEAHLPRFGFQTQALRNQLKLDDPVAQFQFKVSAPTGPPLG